MTPFQKALIVLAGLGLVVWAWLGRYELVTGAGTSSAATGYVLDRWTGQVEFIAGVNRRPNGPPQTAP